jgi:phosphoadenosine phosphosulfate reductase
MDLFHEEREAEAISRIKKFAKIADKMNFEVAVGFSGGKDSQVVYDLCKRAKIKFVAYFNHCFESSTTLRFIKEYYPEVIWRRVVKVGFIANIIKNHGGMLPSITKSYCCEDYKHNRNYVDKCAILGIRKLESAKRAKRTTLSIRNKTQLKKNETISK